MTGASDYNQIRRIIFCAANNPAHGIDIAREWLHTTYRTKLDGNGFKGLCAELQFYERYCREYSLTVAGDMGEHADFAGVFGGQAARFDVTTNQAFKKFSDYEPHMGKGSRYKIALLDENSFEVIDILDLAFPRCESCGGHQIPAVILLGQNYNRHGESQWSNDQLLIDICTECSEYVEKQRTTHSGLFSAREYFDAAAENDDSSALQSTQEHLVGTYKYFRRQFDDMLMAVGSHRYHITDSRGSGYWSLTLDFVNSAVVEDLAGVEIECGPTL